MTVIPRRCLDLLRKRLRTARQERPQSEDEHLIQSGRCVGRLPVAGWAQVSVTKDAPFVALSWIGMAGLTTSARTGGAIPTTAKHTTASTAVADRTTRDIDSSHSNRLRSM